MAKRNITKAVLSSDKSVYFKALIKDKHENHMALSRTLFLEKNRENLLPLHESI